MTMMRMLLSITMMIVMMIMIMMSVIEYIPSENISSSGSI
jgi:hypothetical protein